MCHNCKETVKVDIIYNISLRQKEKIMLFNKKSRHCKCGIKLSGYNRENECFSCRELFERRFMS